MRTNTEIDDKLMKEAMRSANTKTKKETVEAGLRMLIQIKGQAGIRKLCRKVKWEGDLDELRGAQEKTLEW
jgi:Arc/MetJ family transcription regulator